MKNKLEDLEKLDDLLKKGVISEEEFEKEKNKILNSSNRCIKDDLFGLGENTYCFLIHLSIFLGFLAPILGLISPLILWTLNKDKNQKVNQHGRNVLNWVLSFALYLGVCSVLMLSFGGFMSSSMNISTSFPFMVAPFLGTFPMRIMIIINVIFVLVGALKANSGIVWKYPLSISFFKN